MEENTSESKSEFKTKEPFCGQNGILSRKTSTDKLYRLKGETRKELFYSSSI